MKNIRRIIKLLYVLVILTSVLGLFVSGEYGIVFRAAAIAFSFVGLILFFSLLSKFEDRQLEADEQKRKIVELEQKLVKSEELRLRYREAIEHEKAARADTENRAVKARCESHVLNDFNKNVTTPYINMLKSLELPVSDDDKQKVIDMTVDVAMLAVDMADAYEWNINNREEQKINLDLISGEITRKDAVGKAIAMTENPTITPRWARALYQSFGSLVSKEYGIVFSGYKLHSDEKE